MINVSILHNVNAVSYDKANDHRSDKLYIKLSNQNSPRLTHRHVRKMFDMALTYHVYAGNFKTTELSLTITDSQVSKNQIDPDELHQAALKSMQKLFPAKVDFMENFVPGNPLEIPTLVITNTQQFCGASSILYPGVLRKASRMLKGNIYVVPVSTEEVLAFNDQNKDPNLLLRLKRLLTTSNAHFRSSDPLLVLSNNVYHYDADKDMLMPV